MSLGIQPSVKLIHSTRIQETQVNQECYNSHLLCGQAHGIYCSDEMAAFWASYIAEKTRDYKKS